MRINELSAKLGISRSKIYEMLNPQAPHYDPHFAKKIKDARSKKFIVLTSGSVTNNLRRRKLLNMEFDMKHQEIKIIRMKQLTIKLGISRSKIYEMLNPKSPRYDPSFPKPIKLGAHAVGWIESSIDEWIRQKNM